MLQNLARCLRTRPMAVGPAFGSSLTPRRFYATGQNKDIVQMLNKCVDEEASSPVKNWYKIGSLKLAAAAIEQLDFKVQHGDELKDVKGVGIGSRKRINAFLGQEPVEEPSVAPRTLPRTRIPYKKKHLKELLAVPGIGVKVAKALYEAGCDTVAKLHLEQYYKMLPPKVKRTFKHFEYLGAPVPRENAERIMEFCKLFMPTNGFELILAGDYRRGASTILKPIELLIVDEAAGSPVPPPHPSTIKTARSPNPTRTHLMKYQRKDYALLRSIVKPLEDLGVIVSETAAGANVWQGLVRVPKKGESWESRKERLEGVQTMNGDFCLMNITYVPKQSRGSALLFLTGDEEYVLHCTKKAQKAGLYLNASGLWEWEPDSQSLSRFQTSKEPHEKKTLGAMWGSETEEDKGRWVQLESAEEEQVLAAIGEEHVQPEKRNFGFITEGGKRKPKLG